MLLDDRTWTGFKNRTMTKEEVKIGLIIILESMCSDGEGHMLRWPNREVVVRKKLGGWVCSLQYGIWSSSEHLARDFILWGSPSTLPEVD